MEQGPRRWLDETVAVLGVARIQVAQEAELVGLDRWIGARVVDQVEERMSRYLVARTYASDQYAMWFDPFLHTPMMDRLLCPGDYPSGI